MVINHSTAHIPGDIVPSADWNAGHIIDGNAKEVLFRDAAGNIDTASNLVYDPATGYVGIGIAIPTQQLQLTKNIKLTDTTFASQNGIIYKGATPFMHNFNYGDNGTVTTVGYNTFVGGAGNLTMGSTATSTSHASYNTGIGYRSLYSNTTGFQNTANGYASLRSNTTGSNNTALGLQSLYYNTTGYNNSALGVYSLYSNTTGYQNTANGYQAGRFIADGSTANETSTTSVYLGANTKANASGDTNEIVIGDSATGIGSNTVVLGNDSITKTALKGNVGIGTDSPTSTLHVEGSMAHAYVAKTANYTLTASDYQIECTANSFTLTLPTAVGIEGRVYSMKNTGAGSITIDGDGTETIDGELTQTIEQWDNIKIMSNNANWIII